MVDLCVSTHAVNAAAIVVHERLTTGDLQPTIAVLVDAFGQPAR
jgi:hypothetical protein